MQRPACVAFLCFCMWATQRYAQLDGVVSGAALGPCTWVCGGWGMVGGCVHCVLYNWHGSPLGTIGCQLEHALLLVFTVTSAAKHMG